MKKLVILVTVPVVLQTWLKKQPQFLSQHFDVEIITSNSNNIKDIEAFEGVPIKIVDFNRKINFLKDLKVLVLLMIYFLKKRPYIVYTLTPKSGLLGMLAAFLCGIKNRIHNVVGLPHLEASGKRKLILIFTERLTYFCATKLYCNSINLVKEMKKLTKKDVSVIGNGSVNGVDIEFFKNNYTEDEQFNLRLENKIDAKDFTIIFVGRIVEDKGINELISVFTKLQKKYNNLKLLLIGDFEDDLNPLSVSTKQILLSNKSIIHKEFQQDIRDFLAISDLFVLPSYREGLPNVLIEAGSFGLPLLGTDINGCNEIIINNQNGLLVKMKDEESLYKGIERLINDKEFYNGIKSNVRKSIVERYSQDYFYSQLYQEFSKVKI